MEIDNYNSFKRENIIDLRDNHYTKEYIPGSRNILYGELIVYPDKYLKKSENYLLICDYGFKSKKVSIILNKLGYHTYSLKDGMKKYEKNF